MSILRWIYKQVPIEYHNKLWFPPTKRIPARYPGGSTYGWSGGDCEKKDENWWSLFHAIKHTPAGIRREQLNAHWNEGQRTLRIPVFWTGASDKLQKVSGSEIHLTPDRKLPEPYRIELERYVDTAQAIGFQRFLLSSHPVGNRGLGDPKKPWTRESSDENICWLSEAINILRNARADLYVDILNESVDPDGGKFIPLAEYVYMLDTLQSRHPGVRFFFGSRGAPNLFKETLNRFRSIYMKSETGLKYVGMNFYGRSKSAGRQIDLLHRSLPHLKGVIVAESNFNDRNVAQDIRRSLALFNRKVEFLCQWPLARRKNAKCFGEVNVNVAVPTIERRHWAKAGF